MINIRKILSIITVLTIVLLLSISPALAEEAIGVTDEETGTASQSTDESTESVDNEIQNVVVPVIEEKPIDIVEDHAETATQSTDESTEAVDHDVVDVVVPITEGPPLDLAEDHTTTYEAVQPREEDAEYLNSDVLNVIVPLTVSVTIDPLELAGKGQIYSNTYKIKNYGDTDVLLTFTDIQVTFADETSFEPLAQPFDERVGSNLKSIFLMLDFGRDDVPPAVITDPNKKKEIFIPLSSAKYDAIQEDVLQENVEEDSLVQFNFSGNVNEASAQSWRDNDVKISLNYTLMVQPSVEAAVPPVEATTPSEEKTALPEEGVIPPEETTTPEAEPISNSETEDMSVSNPTDMPSESEATASPPESASPESASPESASQETSSPEPSESSDPSDTSE